MNLKYIYYDNFLLSPEKISDKLNELKELCSEIKIISQFNTVDNLQQIKVLFVVELNFKNERCKDEYLNSKGINKPKLSIT